MPPSEQPDQPNSSEPNDGLDRPLGRFSVDRFAKFLAKHPGEKLYVTDVRTAGQRAEGQRADDDGLLRIGADNNLQVKSGRDWLLLISHPGRFQLTPESLARYRNYIMRESEEVTVPEDAAFNQAFMRFIQAIRETATPPVRESPEKTARKNLEQKIEELIRKGHITTWKTGLTISCGSSAAAECLAFARSTQFVIITLRRPADRRISYQAIAGIDAGKMLSDLLINNGHSGDVEILRGNDVRKFGPYALLFNMKDGTLVILNKSETEQYAK